MVGKLSLVIVAVGGCACGLLAMRQARLQAGHEAAQAWLRIRAHDQRLLVLRAEIGRRVTPEAIEFMLREREAEIGSMQPIADATPGLSAPGSAPGSGAVVAGGAEVAGGALAGSVDGSAGRAPSEPR